MITTAGQLVESKGRQVWSVTPTTTVYEALEIMALKDVGAVLVLDGGNVVGILSERDYARKVILLGRASKDTRVEEIMSRSVCYVTPGNTVDECMALITEKHIRHLPVIDNGRLVGLISIGDVVKEIISEQEFKIQELEHYVDTALKEKGKK